MKKIILIVSSFIILVALFSLKVNLDHSNNKIILAFNEDAKAEYGWIMKTVNCPKGPGTFDRCEQEYSSNCDVHAQTLCPHTE